MKNLVAVLFAMLSLNAFSQIPDYVPSYGLAGWWEFDGGFDDRSGNGNHGIAEGNSPPVLGADRHGDDDSALFLTGGGFLNCGDDNSLRATSELSVSFWFFAQEGANNSNNAYHILLNKEGEYEFGFQSGTLYYAIDNSSPNWNWQTIAQNVPSDTWQHFAFTYDGSSIECFMNGIPVYSLSANGSIQDHHPDADALWLGNRPLTDIPFVGALDEVGVWTTALSAFEVLGLFENQVPVGGCTEPTSCNYDASADWDDGQCIPAGCEDEYACNYDATAGCDDGSCDYSCCPGPGCCGAGTTWNWTTTECDVTNPSDSNFDGCVQLSDLLDLLSAYGSCAWQCGDPVSYQGYDYKTVQIGEQCWFAENARYLPQVSPAETGSEDDGLPHAYVYGNESSDVTEAKANENYSLFGALYNYIALSSWQICPNGWHMANDMDFVTLEQFAGMSNEQVQLEGGTWRGTNEGSRLKSLDDNDIWWYSGGGSGIDGGGSDEFGFKALPGGARTTTPPGPYRSIHTNFNIWTPPYARSLAANEFTIWRRALGDNVVEEDACSVRCIKDAE